MKPQTLLIALPLIAASSLALADESPWMMRLRAVDMRPDNPALNVGGADIDVQNKVIPEVDFSYFFTPNVAAELVLTYPQKHDVKLGGTKIGSFKHLPPTLTAQYHFAPQADFRPYVGAGINYTRISNVELGGLELDKNSWGGALQAGFDYKVGANSYINVDVKKVYISSDLSLGGTKIGEVKVDPLLIGIGYGFKF